MNINLILRLIVSILPLKYPTTRQNRKGHSSQICWDGCTEVYCKPKNVIYTTNITVTPARVTIVPAIDRQLISSLKK